jgi:hypothetical protein
MKRLSLTIAAFAAILSVPLLLYIGATLLFSPAFLYGLLVIFVGIPVAIAHAVVYQYVGDKMDIAQKDSKTTTTSNSLNSPTKGTPWENDPGYTNECKTTATSNSFHSPIKGTPWENDPGYTNE